MRLGECSARVTFAIWSGSSNLTLSFVLKQTGLLTGFVVQDQLFHVIVDGNKVKAVTLCFERVSDHFFLCDHVMHIGYAQQQREEKMLTHLFADGRELINVFTGVLRVGDTEAEFEVERLQVDVTEEVAARSCGTFEWASDRL